MFCGKEKSDSTSFQLEMGEYWVESIVTFTISYQEIVQGRGEDRDVWLSEWARQNVLTPTVFQLYNVLYVYR